MRNYRNELEPRNGPRLGPVGLSVFTTFATASARREPRQCDSLWQTWRCDCSCQQLWISLLICRHRFSAAVSIPVSQRYPRSPLGAFFLPCTRPTSKSSALSATQLDPYRQNASMVSFCSHEFTQSSQLSLRCTQFIPVNKSEEISPEAWGFGCTKASEIIGNGLRANSLKTASHVSHVI